MLPMHVSVKWEHRSVPNWSMHIINSETNYIDQCYKEIVFVWVYCSENNNELQDLMPREVWGRGVTGENDSRGEEHTRETRPNSERRGSMRLKFLARQTQVKPCY